MSMGEGKREVDGERDRGRHVGYMNEHVFEGKVRVRGDEVVDVCEHGFEGNVRW